MKRIPKSAPTQMGNGLNAEPMLYGIDDEIMPEPLFEPINRWNVTTRSDSNIEPEPLTMERLNGLLEQTREAPPTRVVHPLSLSHAMEIFRRMYPNIHLRPHPGAQLSAWIGRDVDDNEE